MNLVERRAQTFDLRLKLGKRKFSPEVRCGFLRNYTSTFCRFCGRKGRTTVNAEAVRLPVASIAIGTIH